MNNHVIPMWVFIFDTDHWHNFTVWQQFKCDLMDLPLFVGLSHHLGVPYISIILTKSSQSRESYEFIYIFKPLYLELYFCLGVIQRDRVI
jgi:hypothetical protein